MRTVITGAAGFAASHLIQALQESGEEIFAWAKDEAEAQRIALKREQVYTVDITRQEQVYQALQEIRPDKVYHLAAQASVGLSWKHPALTMEVNSIGTFHLLEGLRQSAPSARVLLVGSAEQYGKVRPQELPVRETRELEGINPYSISKMTQELTARMYAEHFQMHLVMVRAFNHIGPRQSVNFVIPDWCSQIAAIEAGRQEPVIRVGNIQVKRDFTDVRDIVRAYILLLEKGEAGQVYNVGSGISYSLEEILKMIIGQSRVSAIRYEVAPEKLRPADVEEVRADISRLRAVTGWQPSYCLEQSICDIIEEMRRKRF